MKPTFTHIIDWDKVKSVKDVIEILKALDMKFNPDKVNSILKEFIIPINTQKTKSMPDIETTQKHYSLVLQSKKHKQLLLIQSIPTEKVWFKGNEITVEKLIKALEKIEIDE